MTSSLILAFVEREAGRAGVEALLREAGVAGDEARLRDEREWFDHTLKLRLLRACCVVLDDPQACRRLGAASIDLGVGPGVKAAVRGFGSPRLLFSHIDRIGAKFSATHSFESREVTARTAVLAYRDLGDHGYDRRDCDYNIGLLESAPELFGLPPAAVTHAECGADGAGTCVYRVTWTARADLRVDLAAIGTATAGALGASLGGRRLLPLSLALAAGGAFAATRREARAGAVRQQRASVQVRHQHDELRRASARIATLSRSSGPGALLACIAEDGRAAVGAEAAAIVLLEDGRAQVHPGSGLPEGVTRALESWLAGPGHGETCAIDDARAIAGLGDLRRTPFAAGSLCAAPLHFRDERLGTLVALSRVPRAFLGWDSDVLAAHAAHAALVHGNARLLARLEQLAARDPLTGLLNEEGFADLIEGELARSPNLPVAVATLKVTGYAGLVQQQGRAAGDALLRAVACRITEMTVQPGAVGRLGGSEFALLMPGIDAGEAATHVDLVRAATADASRQHCCAGVASRPDHASGVPGLLECAHTALQEAIADGPPTRVYEVSGGVSVSSARRADVLALLERPGTLRPVFQPILAVPRREVVGFEALTRVDAEPAQGPAAWLAQAHQVGLGVELETLAARRALSVPRRPRGTYLAINASPAALADAGFWEMLPADLEDVVVEITEQQAFASGAELERALDRIRTRGGRVALDDAGSGYAGLQQVVRVRPDILKIDRSLIQGLDRDGARRSLLEALIGFAANTGCEVCAEGVETQGELDVLERLGVAAVQGYLLGRPAPAWPAATWPLPALGQVA